MPLALITRLLPAHCPVGVDLAVQPGLETRPGRIYLAWNRYKDWQYQGSTAIELVRKVMQKEG